MMFHYPKGKTKYPFTLKSNKHQAKILFGVQLLVMYFKGAKQARKLQDAQAEKLTSLQANKLTS